MIESCVHPVVIRSLYLVQFTVCLSDITGDQIVLPYSSVIMVIAVHVLSNATLDFPQCVVARAFNIFMTLFNLLRFLCVLRICLGSNLSSSIFMPKALDC